MTTDPPEAGTGVSGVPQTSLRGESSTPEAVVAAWFMRQYEADVMIEAINSGATERPEFKPHAGHFAQAIGSAEGVIKALRSEGWEVRRAAE